MQYIAIFVYKMAIVLASKENTMQNTECIYAENLNNTSLALMDTS
jgi:hypothetical protein